MVQETHVIGGITILGPDPRTRDEKGNFRWRIATAFPLSNLLVITAGIHATQRRTCIEHLNARRQEQGQPPLSSEEERAVWRGAVDLIAEGDAIFIRPDPDNMDLAFKGDMLLQRLKISKRQIKYLGLLNRKVWDAIKRYGELWRITPLPTSRCDIERRIRAARAAIDGRPIYYHNSTTGTRWLTYAQFAALDRLDDAELAAHLGEIQQYSTQTNPVGNPELAFFAAGPAFSAAAFAGVDFGGLAAPDLRAALERLRQQFEAAVPPAFRHDDFHDDAWRNRMFTTLVADNDELITEEMLRGLSPEFFMQIRWLAGARVAGGQLMFDEVYLEEYEHGGSYDGLCDPSVREFLFDLVREYDELEYVNLGRVVNSLSRRPETEGRRDVYLAVLRPRDAAQEVVCVIRMQKWGVREHLNQGCSLEAALLKSEEYTEYVVDRRLACHHLGMDIPLRLTVGKISEQYLPWEVDGQPYRIRSPYFWRDYIPGIATDKMPRQRFANREFALVLARLLGETAAANMIVGRCDKHQRALFDDGDEVVQEDARGLPVRIIVADQTGTFNDYDRDLRVVAAEYADPVNRRLEYLPDADAFAREYLAAFLRRFLAIQQDYRDHKGAFRTMFFNRKCDPAGSFAYRWKRVLERLERTDAQEVAEQIRRRLKIALPAQQSEPAPAAAPA